MSKAFTSEEPEDNEGVEPPALPPGVKNYMTPAGAERFRAEFIRLEQELKQLSAGVESANRRTQIERRLRFLQNRLDSVVVVEPATPPVDRVRFGVRVTLSTSEGEPETWRIVGIDEADLSKGWLSWTSPLAEALLERRSGDQILFRNRRLTITSITAE